MPATLTCLNPESEPRRSGQPDGHGLWRRADDLRHWDRLDVYPDDATAWAAAGTHPGLQGREHVVLQLPEVPREGYSRVA